MLSDVIGSISILKDKTGKQLEPIRIFELDVKSLWEVSLFSSWQIYLSNFTSLVVNHPLYLALLTKDLQMTETIAIAVLDLNHLHNLLDSSTYKWKIKYLMNLKMIVEVQSNKCHQEQPNRQMTDTIPYFVNDRNYTCFVHHLLHLRVSRAYIR